MVTTVGCDFMSAQKWIFKKIRLDKLKLADNNPRTITNRHFQGLLNSIRRFGLVEPIVWNERTGRVVGGHQRYRALVELGVVEATVVAVDLSIEEEMAANLTLNNPAIEGDFDEPINDLLKQLEKSDSSMFKELNMESLESALAKEIAKPMHSTETRDEDTHAECPCCKHKWQISVNDISVDGN